jgi:hypothetical protein
MDINEIIERNYQATVKRGLITPDTSTFKFIDKIEEEVDELKNEYMLFKCVDKEELADIILVCLAMAKHYDIDIMKALEEKTKFNETR